MRTAYRVLAVLVSVVTAFQIAVIALAFFGLLHGVYDDGETVSKGSIDDVTGSVGFALHEYGGNALALVALLLVAVSFGARIPGGTKWAAITFGLVVLQFALAYAARAWWPLGVLHGLNALAVLVVGGIAARVAREASRQDPVAA